MTLDKTLTTADKITLHCEKLRDRLCAKNKIYGNSALEPKRIASDAHPLEQIAVRIDDKLSRLKNMGGLVKVMSSHSPDGEDVVDDLLGYLILAKVGADHREWQQGRLHTMHRVHIEGDVSLDGPVEVEQEEAPTLQVASAK